MATKPKARANDVCGHLDRVHYAKGKCQSCYQGARQKKTRVETIHTEKPAVANHVATAIIMNNMDTEQAVREVLAPNLAPGEQADLAEKLNADPKVQSALEMNLAAKGLDDHSKSEFVAQMWNWLINGDSRRATAAARILGRGFIGEKVDDKKPLVLQIDGFTEGVAKMMEKTTATVPLPANAGADEPDLDEDEDGNEAA